MLLLSGCAHDELTKKPAEEQFETAQELARQNRIEQAADELMMLRTYYPGHELARQALLELGDLYFENREYDLARGNYNEFRMLYPTDPQVSYALYRVGICYYMGIEAPNRDQTSSELTVRALSDFVSAYPDSPYRADAEAKIKEARTVIAEHDIIVGKFYLKKKKNKAACKHFTNTRENYPGLGFDKELDELIEKACEKEEG